MSFLGGITNFLTGGRDQQAEQALNDALAAYGSIKAPTQEQLSLPQLQSFVNAGLMTPAEAQAYLQNSNAFATENIPQTGTDATIQALNELSSIADAGPMGTPVQQAQMAQTIQQMNNAVQGQRGSIEQAMEAKGTPAAMIQAALQNQYIGQDAQQAYLNSVNQQAAAYQAAVQALSEKGALGQALQGQQNTQANTVAQAQNAMQQFNAANQQQASALNANLKQQANAYNTQNAQEVANQNTSTQNARTAYNTQQAQTSFDDAMRRAQGIADVYAKQAGNYQGMGKQSAGVGAGLIGAITSAAGVPNPFGTFAPTQQAAQTGVGNSSTVVPTGAGAATSFFSKGGMVGDHSGCYHDGGICMEEGGMVPGHPEVPGDSLRNDKVHIMASPGEAVIPRTAVQAHMPEVLGLIAGARQDEPVHPHDVATMLKALREIRLGAA